MAERNTWTRPWRLTEGFLIGGGLVVAGLMLQLSTGGIDWDLFAFPANAIVLTVFVLLVVAAAMLCGRVYAFRFLCSLQAAIPALVYAVVLTIVMGVTRQTVNGQWLHNMLSFWPFVLIYVYIAVIVGMVSARRLMHVRRWRDIPFLLNHLGLFVVLLCATLGNADLQRMKMICSTDKTEWRAVDQQGNLRELPIAIELKRFIMETYDDGSPRRFASEIQILTQTGKNIHATVDVNKPVRVDGWNIYQYGYDTAKGSMSRISIFELVSDPWLPAVYAGIVMMMLGAVCMFFKL